MPRFQIVLEGSDIAVTGGVAGVKSAVVRGFFVARYVQAASREAAIARARALVIDDWRHGIYAHLNAVPALTVADLQEVGFWRWLLPRNTGYIFHPGK
jgi:hypothetical protein